MKPLTQLKTEVVSTVKAVLENALQEEVTAFLQGRVLSVNAVNQITLHVQRQQEARQTVLLSQTPEIILVDGVWVEIQYVIPDEYKFGQSGHLRQCRKSEERVVLAVMAIWADGRSELLHYEVADGESEATWNRLFKNLIARGFDMNALEPETLTYHPPIATQANRDSTLLARSWHPEKVSPSLP
jgi:predicted methyltransferase MtxX (methanogen marker protein 4)